MSQLTLNTFSTFKQSEQEQIAGTSFCTEQKQFIQNQIAVIAEERLALVPDANNYASFIQQEAHLKGQMDAYKYLLDCATNAELLLLEAAEQQQ